MKWDDQLKGIVLAFEKVQLMNGGKGRIMDDYSWIQYIVRYSVTYAQPKVDECMCKLNRSKEIRWSCARHTNWIYDFTYLQSANCDCYI